MSGFDRQLRTSRSQNFNYHVGQTLDSGPPGLSPSPYNTIPPIFPPYSVANLDTRQAHGSSTYVATIPTNLSAPSLTAPIKLPNAVRNFQQLKHKSTSNLLAATATQQQHTTTASKIGIYNQPAPPLRLTASSPKLKSSAPTPLPFSTVMSVRENRAITHTSEPLHSLQASANHRRLVQDHVSHQVKQIDSVVVDRHADPSVYHTTPKVEEEDVKKETKEEKEKRRAERRAKKEAREKRRAMKAESTLSNGKSFHTNATITGSFHPSEVHPLQQHQPAQPASTAIVHRKAPAGQNPPSKPNRPSHGVFDQTYPRSSMKYAQPASSSVQNHTRKHETMSTQHESHSYRPVHQHDSVITAYSHEYRNQNSHSSAQLISAPLPFNRLEYEDTHIRKDGRYRRCLNFFGCGGGRGKRVVQHDGAQQPRPRKNVQKEEDEYDECVVM